MNRDLSNSQYIPPQIWKMMLDLGYFQWVKDNHPNMWVDLTLSNMDATLMLFVYERQQYLKGKSE